MAVLTAFFSLQAEKKRKKDAAGRRGGGMMAGDDGGELEPGRGMAAGWLEVCRRSWWCAVVRRQSKYIFAPFSRR